jgi:hypothetical protein
MSQMDTCPKLCCITFLMRPRRKPRIRRQDAGTWRRVSREGQVLVRRRGQPLCKFPDEKIIRQSTSGGRGQVGCQVPDPIFSPAWRSKAGTAPLPLPCDGSFPPPLCGLVTSWDDEPDGRVSGTSVSRGVSALAG